MKKMFCGFLVGVSLLLAAKYILQDHIGRRIEVELQSNDQNWQDRLSAEIEQYREACSELLKEERKNCERRSAEDLRRAFRDGLDTGEKRVRAYYDRMLEQQSNRFSIALRKLQREKDSLNFQLQTTVQQLSVILGKNDSLQSMVKMMSGKLLRNKKRLESMALLSETRPSEPLVLTGYFTVAVIAVVLITLLIMRFRLGRKRVGFK